MADRAQSMNGMGTILYSAISIWARDHDIYDADEILRLKILINRMDIAYLDYKRPPDSKK